MADGMVRAHPAGSEQFGESHRHELLREGLAMALYISLSLLVIMVALPNDTEPSTRSVLVVALAVDTLGLLAAHWLAFRLAGRIAYRALLGRDPLQVLGAQVVGGVGAGLVAILPVVLLDPAVALRGAEVVLVGLILVVGVLAARAAGAARNRALLYAGVIDLGAAGVLVVKATLSS